MSWTFITVTFIQDVYIFKKYPTQRQLLKTGRLLKTQEYTLLASQSNIDFEYISELSKNLKNQQSWIPKVVPLWAQLDRLD